MEIRYHFDSDDPPAQFEIHVSGAPAGWKMDKLMPGLVRIEDADPRFTPGREICYIVLDADNSGALVKRRQWLREEDMANTDPNHGDVMEWQRELKQAFGVDSAPLAVFLNIMMRGLATESLSKEEALAQLKDSFPNVENPEELVIRAWRPGKPALCGLVDFVHDVPVKEEGREDPRSAAALN